jgi:hypothetical protein
MSAEDRVVIALEGHASTPSQARSFVRVTLEQWGLGHLEDPLTLLTSELATNVVLHARTSYEVHLERRPDAVRLTVLDDSPVGPTHRRTPLRAATGRGIALLDTLSRDWGRSDRTTCGDRAKGIWCEVSLDASDLHTEGAMYGGAWDLELSELIEL